MCSMFAVLRLQHDTDFSGQVEIVKAGAVAKLIRLSQSSCAIEADTANMALKTLNAVSSTREAIAKMGVSSNGAAKIEL
jgi:hypothetical protein